jgi:hypothetical protein
VCRGVTVHARVRFCVRVNVCAGGGWCLVCVCCVFVVLHACEHAHACLPVSQSSPHLVGIAPQPRAPPFSRPQPILKTTTTTAEEEVYVPAQEEREPWSLPMSIFKGRAREADARSFYDGPAVRRGTRGGRAALAPTCMRARCPRRATSQVPPPARCAPG